MTKRPRTKGVSGQPIYRREIKAVSSASGARQRVPSMTALNTVLYIIPIQANRDRARGVTGIMREAGTV